MFLGGWPDDSLSGWSPLFEQLKARYRIVSLCPPQFESNCTEVKPWGYTFDELVSMMDDSIKNAECKSPFTLIVHDWGSIIGMLYQKRFPHKVKSMIIVDVGIKGPKDTSLWEILLIVLYQWWNAWAYIVSQLFGTYMGYVVMLCFATFFKAFPFLQVCPYDKPHRPMQEVLDPHKLHLYYRFWRDFLMGRPLRPPFPTCPFLYMVRKVIWGYLCCPSACLLALSHYYVSAVYYMLSVW